jgi:hypothetical protein
MAIEIVQREALQMVVGPHAEIVGDPLSHALRVIVRDIGGERPHHSDNHHHDRSSSSDLHFGAAGQHWFQDVVEPRGELVAADNVIQNDFERPGCGAGKSFGRLPKLVNLPNVARPHFGPQKREQHSTRTQRIPLGGPPFRF